MDEALSKFELVMLSQALKRPEGIEIWNITRRIGISVHDAANAFKSLLNIGFLIQHDDTIRLTPKGRGWIMKNQSAFAFSGIKSWRNVPSHFQSSTILAFEPYAPRISQLDKKFFKICVQENDV